MPRTHGRVMSSIWDDPDFIELPAGPQRLYMFLLSQPDLSHAGLVPMRLRKWSRKVAANDVADVARDLAHLAKKRFVVSDDETEEVLIRTFVRNDGVYKQPKVMLRLREDAKQIESPKLRATFLDEIQRLPLDELSVIPSGRDHDGPSTREAVEHVVDTLIEDFRKGMPYPSERVSDTQPDTPRVRAGAFPLPPTPVPLPPAPIPPTAGVGKPTAAIATIDSPTSQTLIAEWIDHCSEPPPSRVKGHIARELKTMLDTDGLDYQRVRAGLAEWAASGQHPSTLASFVHAITERKAKANTRSAESAQMFERALARAEAKDRMSATEAMQ